MHNNYLIQLILIVPGLIKKINFLFSYASHQLIALFKNFILFLLTLIFFLCLLATLSNIGIINQSRYLSIDTDLITGENLRTVNGHVPLASCPIG